MKNFLFQFDFWSKMKAPKTTPVKRNTNALFNTHKKYKYLKKGAAYKVYTFFCINSHKIFFS